MVMFTASTRTTVTTPPEPAIMRNITVVNNNNNNSDYRNNNSDANDASLALITEWATIEFPLTFQLLVTVCGILAVFINSVTMAAMASTTRILYANRYMAVGLAMFDMQYAMSAVAFVWSSGMTSRGITFSISILWIGLSYLNVCMMSMERYMALRHPYRYIKYVANHTQVGRIIVICWTTLVILFLANYYGLCSFFGQWPTSEKFCTANNIVNGVFVIMLTAVSVFCNLNVYYVVAREARTFQVSSAGNNKVFRQNRTCVATCVLFSSNLFTYTMVLIVTICSSLYLLSTLTLYSLMVAIHLVNSYTDPLVYVMWYKECRYKLCSFLAVCTDRYKHRSEVMKLEAYSIVSMEAHSSEHITTRNTCCEFHG